MQFFVSNKYTPVPMLTSSSVKISKIAFKTLLKVWSSMVMFSRCRNISQSTRKRFQKTLLRHLKESRCSGWNFESYMKFHGSKKSGTAPQRFSTRSSHSSKNSYVIDSNKIVPLLCQNQLARSQSGDHHPLGSSLGLQQDNQSRHSAFQVSFWTAERKILRKLADMYWSTEAKYQNRQNAEKQSSFSFPILPMYTMPVVWTFSVSFLITI